MFGREQRGATLLGTLVIVAIIGFGVYAGIRLFPLYMEFFAVSRALDQTAKEAKGEATSVQDLKVGLDRRWTIEDIKSINSTDVEIKRSGKGFRLHTAYRAEAPFVANISLVVDFEKSADVGGAAVE
jgi:hypothetical protein